MRPILTDALAAGALRRGARRRRRAPRRRRPYAHAVHARPLGERRGGRVAVRGRRRSLLGARLRRRRVPPHADRRRARGGRDPRLPAGPRPSPSSPRTSARPVAGRGDRHVRVAGRESPGRAGSASRTGSRAPSSSSRRARIRSASRKARRCSSAASRRGSSSRSAPAGRPVIRLDREAARGDAIELDRGRAARAGEGEYYAFQLVGLEVEEDGGATLGRVREVSSGPANDVLELDTGLALPLVDACVQRGRSRRGSNRCSTPASPTDSYSPSLCESTSSRSSRTRSPGSPSSVRSRRARHRARAPAAQLPRHDAAPGRPGRRRPVRRRRGHGAARRRRRGRARSGLRRGPRPQGDRA